MLFFSEYRFQGFMRIHGASCFEKQPPYSRAVSNGSLNSDMIKMKHKGFTFPSEQTGEWLAVPRVEAPRHLDHGHPHHPPGGGSRTFSLPNVLPLMCFWLILSPSHTSELMTVLGWRCPDPLKPTLSSILLAAGETGARLAYKKRGICLLLLLLLQDPITSTYSPWEVWHSWDPPNSPGTILSLCLCLRGTDWIKYCSHSRWWNQDL